MSKSVDPPYPSGSPLAHTIRFFRDPFQLFLDATEECGEVFSLRLLGVGDWVVLCSKETLKAAYEAPSGMLVTGEPLGKMAGFMLGLNATAFLDGPAHKTRQQRVLPLLNGSATLRHVHTMRIATERMIARWPVAESFALMPVLNKVALEVIVRSLLGLEEEAKIDRLVREYDHFTEKCLRSSLIAMPLLQVDFGSISPWGRILRQRDHTRAIFKAIIDERRRRFEESGIREGTTENADILDELMFGTSAEEELSAEALIDELMALLFAGHETTSTSLGWIIALALGAPGVVERIREEVDEVLAGQPIDRSHLPNLKYLDAVINEGLRLGRRTPFTGLRLVKSPFAVAGYEIPSGRIVALSHYSVCHREDTYPGADRFEPERFLEKQVTLADWSPFGRGDRACAGRGFAMVELKVVLATLFQRAKFELSAPVVKAVRQGFLFAPERGLSIKLIERRA